MEHGVRLTLAYDGTEFAGFQRQPQTRTVQGVLEQALARIAQADVITRGASRTDAGVHAEGQVVAFATTRELAPERWLLATNRYLPADVAVQAAEVCTPDYDPRFDALHKTYRYLIYTGVARQPLLRTRAWQLVRDAQRARAAGRAPLDLQALQLTAASMLGTHDFGAFRAADDTRERTTRTLHELRVIPEFRDQPELLALEVRGDAFLKNMVRILAGTLVAVGRGKLAPDDVRALLRPGAQRSRYSETAPAHGLTLVHVKLGRLNAPESPTA